MLHPVAYMHSFEVEGNAVGEAFLTMLGISEGILVGETDVFIGILEIVVGSFEGLTVTLVGDIEEGENDPVEVVDLVVGERVVSNEVGKK
jgi:hypothetical protein